MISPDVLVIVTKIASASAGAVGGLALMPPISVRDALRRAVFSVVFGVLCYPLAADYLHLNRTPDNDVGGIVVASALSWFVFGAFVRLSQKWSGPK